MISGTRRNRRCFKPSVDFLESRQLLSTVRPPASTWVPNPGPIVVTQGQVDKFDIKVKTPGSYRLDFKAEQSVFDKNQPLTTILAVVADKTDPSETADSEFFSPVSTASYVEFVGQTFSLQSGHSYSLYLNEGTVGGSDVLIRELKIIPTSQKAQTMVATFTDSGFPASFNYDGSFISHTFTVSSTGVYLVTFDADPDISIFTTPPKSVGIAISRSTLNPTNGLYWNLGIVNLTSSGNANYASQSARLLSGVEYTLTFGVNPNTQNGAENSVLGAVQVIQIGGPSAIGWVNQV